jgi:CRISPR/Cas system-associated exonuclease Cas4 (RecB family)
MIYSFSRLHLYATCPYRFRMKYLEGYEERVTKPLALGKAVHKAVEAVFQGSSYQEAVLKGWVEADFHKEVTSEEISDLTKRAPLIEDYKQTEYYFKLPLFDSPKAPVIQGYIDLVVNEGEKIIDWKTNRRMYGVQDNHQVSLYAWAISRLAGIKSVKGSLYFLRFRKEMIHTFHKDEMEHSRQWALQLIQEIERKIIVLDFEPDEADNLFPAAPGSSCSHCPFAAGCYQKFGRY